MSIINYLIGLLVFTLSVWAFELIWILFAIVIKSRKFINFLSGFSSLITGLYGIVLCLGAFFWLVDVTNLVLAVVLSLFFGSFIFGIAALPATLANLPFQLLAVWAEDKIPSKQKH